MVKHATRSGGDGQLLAGLPDPDTTTSRASKQGLVRDALRDASRRLLKRKKPDEEGETDDDQQQQHFASSSKEPHDSLIPAATAPPAKPRKRNRGAMGYSTIAIHEDTSARTQHLHVPEFQIMTKHDPNVPVPWSDEGEDEDADADEDGHSEDEVDDTVAEDMRKLEENFKGISQKYRLINRIGEGTLVLPETRSISNLPHCRNFLDRLQSRTARCPQRKRQREPRSRR